MLGGVDAVAKNHPWVAPASGFDPQHFDTFSLEVEQNVVEAEGEVRLLGGEAARKTRTRQELISQSHCLFQVGVGGLFDGAGIGFTELHQTHRLSRAGGEAEGCRKGQEAKEVGPETHGAGAFSPFSGQTASAERDCWSFLHFRETMAPQRGSVAALVLTWARWRHSAQTLGPAMKPLTQTLVMFLVGLLGGVVGALIFSPAPSSEPNTSTEASASGVSIEKQLEQMQEQLDGLSRSVDLHGSTLSQLEDSQDNIAEDFAKSLAKGVLPDGTPLQMPMNMGDLPAGPGFDTMVAAVIEQRDQEEAEARDLRRQEAQERQIEERSKRLAEELGLDAVQTDQLAKVMTETSDARTKYFQEMRENGTWDRDAIREGMETLRVEESEKLADFLTPTQLEQYGEQSNSFGGRGFGGGGGTRGGTNGGTGGGQGGRSGGF